MEGENKKSSLRALSSLNPYFYRYKRYLIGGAIFVIISNIFGVLAPVLVRNALNLIEGRVEMYQKLQGMETAGILDKQITQSLLVYAGLVLLMSLCRGLFLFFTRQTLIVMSRLIERDLRVDMYNKYQELSLSFFRRNKTGDLMARVSEDIPRVRMYLGPGVMYTINTLSLLVIVISTMVMVNPGLTFYALLPLPILSLSIYYVESIVQRKSDMIQRQLSRLTSFTQEAFSGIKVLKAYNREKAFSEEFKKENHVFMAKSMGLALVQSLFFPLIMLLVGLSTILAVWIGGEKVVGGSLTVGNVAEFIIYINMLTWPIISLGWISTLIQRAAASQIRLDELLNEEPEINFPEESENEMTSTDIEFRNVQFTYPDTGIRALNDISFVLPKGGKLGILGPPGSGKSTICNLIPRLLEVTQGGIYIGGNDIKSFSAVDLRSKIGYATQDLFLFSESLKENIRFGKDDASMKNVESAARMADIFDSITGFPKGFETEIGERGITLSGGQKQRVSLARALIRRPKLLILDDTLSAVDTGTEKYILNNLKNAKKDNPDLSVVIAGHRISALQDADIIIVLEDGNLTQIGKHSELITQEGYYKGIYQKQSLKEEKVD